MGGGVDRQDSEPFQKPCRNHFYFQSKYTKFSHSVCFLCIQHTEYIKSDPNEDLQLANKTFNFREQIWSWLMLVKNAKSNNNIYVGFIPVTVPKIKS